MFPGAFSYPRRFQSPNGLLLFSGEIAHLSCWQLLLKRSPALFNGRATFNVQPHTINVHDVMILRFNNNADRKEP
jgi:hypothetical protein